MNKDKLKKEEKLDEKCDNCGTKLVAKKREDTIHYAEKRCPNCRKFHGWLQKKENKNKRTKTSKRSINDVIEFHNMEEKRCFFCRRTKEQLGKNETLTIDHIKELSKGGKDEIENLQILCIACHKLKNWNRLYHNWHYNGR